MPNIAHHLLSVESFDPEILAIMGDAYDRAVQSFKTRPTYIMRKAIATEIVLFSECGVRDPQELCRRALQPFTVDGHYADVA
jgi:hypothetical protein